MCTMDKFICYNVTIEGHIKDVVELWGMRDGAAYSNRPATQRHLAWEDSAEVSVPTLCLNMSI